MHQPYRMFEKYRKGAEVFVESGTYQGGAIEAALELGYSECYSVEFNPPFYYECTKTFDNNKNVHLFLGSAEDKMKEFLPKINKRCLFWLDAHDTFGTGGGVPTFEELLVIKDHPIKNHTIIIDDIPLYFGDGKEVTQRVLDINPNYIIERVNPHGDNPQFIEYCLVAYIDD